MTVSTEISSNEYTGNGVTTDFDYKFRIFKANQLSVITSDADGDNVVTLRLGTDYTVTGANKSAGGKVILTRPLANGHKISIARDIPITQETSFRNQSKFFAETHEDAFDYLTMILQRIWGSLGSLYLKRPNILANWFDAKGYRIANLGKPKRDSDAVDLGTLKDEISGVNSTILKREKRLLRVDDMDIAVLPKASDRAGNVLTFDKDGKPIVVAPASGSAVDVLNQLAGGDGSLIGLDHGTLKDAINYVTPEMFGDTDGDAYAPLQKALSSPLPCKLAAKTYRTSKPLYYDSGKVIEGAGELVTRIVKYTDSKSGLGIININGKPMDYDVDAVLIARASEQYWYNHFTRLSGFTLVREGNVEDITQVFGWYAPLICQNAYSNIHVEGQCTGIFTVDYWMLSWNRVESFCAAPWVMGYEGTPWIANGTSNVFNACWAHSAKGDNYAWDIRNIMYSEMIGGGTDKIGSDGSPCAGMMRFKNSRMTLSNVGGEKIHATRLVRATDGSVIALNQCDFFNVYNKYAPENITWDNVNVLFQAVGNSTIIFDGTGVNAIYDFDSGLPNISSLAHAVDRSKIIWKGNSRSRPLLQEINRSAGDKKTKYGITWASSSKVQIHTEGIFIDDESDGENKNLGTDVKVLDKIHSTFRAFKTSSYIESKSSELNGGHLDALRVRGNISFHSPSAVNNSIANGYPEDGGAYFINQHSTGGIGLYTRTIQEAIKTDDTGWVYKWVRGAEWGKPFGKWHKVGIN
ncbi:hypothetical protein ACLI07_11195 [Providencia huaxiensis]|uniref:hypothetical protein n=1 Tax=Providencia TaxID=586 RepID=UPI000D8E7557|nr:hypothetical protein [Providencia stuartii]TPW78676.1 hypothetical protein DL505_10635 [Providencia stuartii]SPY60688.1 Uncharacterised protein [Providencia stuartii]